MLIGMTLFVSHHPSFIAHPLLSLAPTQQLPSLADRLRQLRGAWANSGASTRSASNDLDIEDDDPPLTTRSLRKNKASDKGREKDEPPTKKARIENDAVRPTSSLSHIFFLISLFSLPSPLSSP